MAFESGLAEDVLALGQFPGKRHKLRFVVTGPRYVLINKMWIDNFSENLNQIDTPYLSISLPHFPKMKFFPFFMEPFYELEHNSPEGIDELDFLLTDATGCGDVFPYVLSNNVANGMIRHPLDNTLIDPTFQLPGYLGPMRDNYRLKKRIRLYNTTNNSDALIINFLFCTNVIDNYSGRLNIQYWSVPFTGIGDLEFKELTINLAGKINKSNVSEIDYTNIEVVSEIEGVDLTNPFVSIELG